MNEQLSRPVLMKLTAHMFEAMQHVIPVYNAARFVIKDANTHLPCRLPCKLDEELELSLTQDELADMCKERHEQYEKRREAENARKAPGFLKKVGETLGIIRSSKRYADQYAYDEDFEDDYDGEYEYGTGRDGEGVPNMFSELNVFVSIANGKLSPNAFTYACSLLNTDDTAFLNWTVREQLNLVDLIRNTEKFKLRAQEYTSEPAYAKLANMFVQILELLTEQKSEIIKPQTGRIDYYSYYHNERRERYDNVYSTMSTLVTMYTIVKALSSDEADAECEPPTNAQHTAKKAEAKRENEPGAESKAKNAEEDIVQEANNDDTITE